MQPYLYALMVKKKSMLKAARLNYSSTAITKLVNLQKKKSSAYVVVVTIYFRFMYLDKVPLANW